LTAFSAFAENYIPIEKGQDEDGRINGTFVRKDLVIEDSSSLTEQNSAREVAPGLFLHLPPEINATMEVRLRLDTFWETRQPLTEDLSYQIKLSNPAGQIIHEESAPLGYGWYPTSAWQTGDVFRQHIQLPGDLPAGEYTIELSLISDKGDTTSGRSLPANYQPSTVKLMLAQSGRVLPQNPPNPNPSARAKELYLAAKKAVKQTPMNWEKAYELYLAAWLTDPDNVWAQRGLEYARRMAIL